MPRKPKRYETKRPELSTINGSRPTKAQLELAIVRWVGWFNTERLHSEIGDIPPAEFETLGDALRSPSGLAARDPDPIAVSVR